jgi:hypothetical protein
MCNDFSFLSFRHPQLTRKELKTKGAEAPLALSGLGRSDTCWWIGLEMKEKTAPEGAI